MNEIYIGPYDDGIEFSAPASDIIALLTLAGVDIEDCLFSGHGSENLGTKMGTDLEDLYGEMPPEASDDALLIFFGRDLFAEDETENPLWYAFLGAYEQGADPRVDVVSARILNEIVDTKLLEVEDDLAKAYLTEDQLKQASLGQFVIMFGSNS